MEIRFDSTKFCLPDFSYGVNSVEICSLLRQKISSKISKLIKLITFLLLCEQQSKLNQISITLFLSYIQFWQQNMASHQDKESLALNSLYDISDYTSYIDQRLQKLDLLYKRLSTDKAVRAKVTSFKARSSLSQQPKTRMFQTIRQKLKSDKRDNSQLLQASYHTQYLPMANSRYKDTLSPFHSLDFKSEKTNGKSLNLKNSRQTYSRSFCKSKQQKLKDYQRVKQEIMGNFYVGGNQIINTTPEPQLYLRHSQWKEGDIKFRKGRLWHGRPPVKIIQKFE